MPTNLRVIPAENLPRWSRYAAMMRDCAHAGGGRGDGVLTLAELDQYIAGLHDERTELLRASESTMHLDMRIRESKDMRQDIQNAGVDGLSYLPRELEALDLPTALKTRATELLMHDDRRNRGTITQEVIDRGRSRYLNMDARSAHLIQVKDRALQEITELARKLHLI